MKITQDPTVRDQVELLAKLAGVEIYWTTRFCKGGEVTAPFRVVGGAPWRPAQSIQDALEVATSMNLFKDEAFQSAVLRMPFSEAVCEVALARYSSGKTNTGRVVWAAQRYASVHEGGFDIINLYTTKLGAYRACREWWLKEWNEWNHDVSGDGAHFGYPASKRRKTHDVATKYKMWKVAAMTIQD